MKHGLITLTVSQAKRLIAKGVKQLPSIQQALDSGIIVVAGGTTNAFVAEELAGLHIDKARYTAGIICGGRCCVTDPNSRLQPIVLVDGQVADISWTDALAEMGSGDVFIKGGNALDAQGNVGILLGSTSGGTIGKALGHISARGIQLVVPIGLEKMIPSVPQAASMMGISKFDYSRGMPCGMQVLSSTTVVSEDRALSLLSGCQAVAVAGGGVAASTGAITLAFAGSSDQIKRAIAICKEIESEPPVSGQSQPCPCPNSCHYGRP